MLTYDQARQFGKRYTGALNTGIEEYRALFAADAEVVVDGRPATLERVCEVTPPGRSGHRGARLDPPEVVFTIRVRGGAPAEVTDREHRLLVDDAGHITRLTV